MHPYKTLKKTRSQPSKLQPRVDLINHMVRSECIPIITRLLHHIWQFYLRDILRLFDSIDIQASADVPSDVTMEWPNTRIVGLVFNDQVACLGLRLPPGHNLDITPDWVRRVGSLNSAVPGLGTLREDPEIVAVEMHGVSHWGNVLDIEPD